MHQDLRALRTYRKNVKGGWSSPPPGYTRWPPKNGIVDFSGLCSDQQLSFSPCWIEHLSLIVITPRTSNLVENFLFYESFLMHRHFRDLPDFQSSEARLTAASAIQKLSEYCVQWSVYCLTRTYNPGTWHWDVRQYTDHWTQYSLNLWMAEAVINHASKLWKSGKSQKLVHKKFLIT